MNSMMPVMNALAPLVITLVDFRRERDFQRDNERRLGRRFGDTDWIEREMDPHGMN